MISPSARSKFPVAAAAVVTCFIFGSGCDTHSPAQVASQAAIHSSPTSAPTSSSTLPSPSLPVIQRTKSYTTVGPLVAVQQADVAAERDGRVVRIAVEIGDHVQKGQVLALLDDSMLRATRDAQKARVASLQAQVLDWQAEQKSVEADLHRADSMLADKIISRESWEHVKYKLDETVAEVARHHADETVAEDELQGASVQLEKSRIVAPFAGVVGRSSVRIAQQVKEGDVLFWITAVAPLRILFTVPESEMAAFRTGAALELTTPDYPSLRQPARILRVSPVVDPASGSVQIIGAVVRPSRLLKPGMSMQVRLAP
ncbi:MAG TPA: efflux RND transporter periplasmic adaptor subunit [Acidobacteriaceae bacterium]|nr:efflux RND transporter periplasmic adaptor subunit [Acidobacteriaceae bacterium]